MRIYVVSLLVHQLKCQTDRMEVENGFGGNRGERVDD